MKKTVFILLANLFTIAGASVFSQNLQSFVQFEYGIGENSYKNASIWRGEYGETWKWLDVSLSVSYESPYGNNSYYVYDNFDVNTPVSLPHGGDFSFAATTFSLNVRIDIIRLFTTNSRHAFKVGCGLGYEFSYEYYRSHYGRDYEVLIDNDEQFVIAPRASYEFAITPKYTVGAFLNMSSFLSNAVGLSIRRNF
ncbi:MAG: hypothetical protein LBH32_02695 [Dysgonamonadaceae bacterium]|nr:hypothetical protein [Dysgonamonadaceae bacterium]